MVEMKLVSKRYNCNLRLNEKLTFIKGSSGIGKTELTRRLVSNTTANEITVSNGFDIVVLDEQQFKTFYKLAARHRTEQEKEEAAVKRYWQDGNNFPYQNCIIIIDDEDFVKTKEFSVFYNEDHSNYYVLISRVHISNIGYSVNEVYEFKSKGKEHWIERCYKYKIIDNLQDISVAIVEGTGSDFVFFRELLSDEKIVLNPTSNNICVEGGRTNVIKFLDQYGSKLSGKTVLLIVDYCAFGSNLDAVLEICKRERIYIVTYFKYWSFEYLLLNTNLIKDSGLNEFIEKNVLQYANLEKLFMDRLCGLTKENLFKYAKSPRHFPVCYYKNCCYNTQYRAGECSFRRLWDGKDKFEELLKDTIFEKILAVRKKVC